MIQRVTNLGPNTVTVFGTQLVRPPQIPSTMWNSFWSWGSHRFPVELDRWTAQVFGATVRRPPGVTVEDWNNFWIIRMRAPREAT
jgi:hypothetical protein